MYPHHMVLWKSSQKYHQIIRRVFGPRREKKNCLRGFSEANRTVQTIERWLEVWEEEGSVSCAERDNFRKEIFPLCK